MSASVSRACLRTIVISVLAAAPFGAQQVPSDSAVGPEARPTWAERLSVSVRYSDFRLSAKSEMFVLLDRELAPGSRCARTSWAGRCTCG